MRRPTLSALIVLYVGLEFDSGPHVGTIGHSSLIPCIREGEVPWLHIAKFPRFAA
jgi:hypothetical protein